MGVVYATRGDLYKHGVPNGTMSLPSRAVPPSAVDIASNRIGLEAHGLETDHPLQVVVAPGGSPPAPLSTAAVYYARPVAGSDSLLEVAATPGGAAIDLVTQGVEPWGVAVQIGPTLDRILEVWSRIVDRHLPAHAVPLNAPYPIEVVDSVALLAAAEILGILGRSSPSTEARAERRRRELKVLLTGLPLRDEAVTTDDTNLATSWGDTERGWDSEGEGRGLIP